MTTPSICTRSIAAAVAISLAGYFAPVVSAQTTATTVPVGFITKTIPAAADALTPSNLTLSIPLYSTADFQSSVASVDSANSLTLTSAAWTAGQFATAAAPRLVRVKTGASTGRFFLVSANTTNQVTVVLPPSVATLAGAVSVGDSCEIVPANTLATVFGATATGFVTGASAGVADNILIWNGATWDILYNNGTNWRKSGNLGNQNNVVVFPDDGLFLSHKGLSSTAITLMGTVPSTSEVSDLDGSAGATFLGNRFPVDTTLLSLGLHTTSNWTSGASAGVSDNVLLWNGFTWDVYYYNGANWRKSGNLVNQNATTVPVATAVYVTRKNALASTLPQVLPYSL